MLSLHDFLQTKFSHLARQNYQKLARNYPSLYFRNLEYSPKHLRQTRTGHHLRKQVRTIPYKTYFLPIWMNEIFSSVLLKNSMHVSLNQPFERVQI